MSKNGSEDKSLMRLVRTLKFGAGFIFLAVNGYLAYRLGTAYSDGQERGEILQREKERKKKEGYIVCYLVKK